VCLLVRVTVGDKDKALLCSLLATSAIMLCEKKKRRRICSLLATSAIMLCEKKKRRRKMWDKKWYLKRNISCDARLLDELLETDVP